MEIDLVSRISAVGTLSLGGGIGMLTKSGRIKAKAEAMKAMCEAYEMRLGSVHEVNANLNANEIKMTNRIAQLDATIDDKVAQIRKLNERTWTSEQELNRANERITKLTEERDKERRLKEYYKRWRCEKSTCEDPEGRRPPNSKLATETYIHPEKENVTIINLTKNA